MRRRGDNPESILTFSEIESVCIITVNNPESVLTFLDTTIHLHSQCKIQSKLRFDTGYMFRATVKLGNAERVNQTLSTP